MTSEWSRPVSACAVAGRASCLVDPVMIAVPGGAAFTVQPGLERIEDVWNPLVLVDADRGPGAHRGGQVPLDRLTHFNVVEVDHRAAGCLGEAAEHRRLAHRSWTMQRDHRLGAHLFGQQIADAAWDESIELHAAALAGPTMSTLQT